MSLCCIECGNLTDKIFIQKVTHFQINRCEHCGNFVDKCFELNTTARFIELFLVKDRVLRHFMLNVKVDTRILVFYAIIVVWIKVMFIVKTSPIEADVNSYYASLSEVHIPSIVFVWTILIYIVIAATEYVCYVVLVMTLCYSCKVNSIVVAKTIILSSYFQIFGFLAIIWNYQNYWIYEAISDILTLFVNVKSLNIITSSKIKKLEIRVVFSKLISMAVGYILLSLIHH